MSRRGLGAAKIKPKGMEDHLTRGELADKVGKSARRILQLEQAGLIAAPVRVKTGLQTARLYSPKEVAKIQRYFEEHGRHYPRRRPPHALDKND